MNLSSVLFSVVLAMFILSGCGAIETIFRAGVAWAIFISAFVLIVMLIILNRSRK